MVMMFCGTNGLTSFAHNPLFTVFILCLKSKTRVIVVIPLNVTIFCLFSCVLNVSAHVFWGIDQDQDIKVHPFVMIIGFVCFMHVLGDGRRHSSYRIVPREDL